ncbi:MAG: hypothetical protein EAZ60_25915 [Oscillatoriales cyanobacterium]|nr:MAG: hypothetical protein EAZ83_31185 [Oscillatoriales cyanobacterium]TAF12914.1 MAG: hypothetical protein EAZ73_31065 [Oscillatoriales cyanobacterium]TAF31586.1 MAG: hypothetical protein EAZ69_19130 [Oscillatoriales cyanobacterium]TAF51538.1 MAG: hypothetical protein EAZ60_25915 [Oscillatoriales cyanobacterium]
MKFAPQLCYIFYHSLEFDRATPASRDQLKLGFPVLAGDRTIDFLSRAPNLKIASGICEFKPTARRGATKKPCGC